jgi:hypothetical protein
MNTLMSIFTKKPVVENPSAYSMVKDGHTKGFVIEHLLLYPKYNLCVALYEHILAYIALMKQRDNGRELIAKQKEQQTEYEETIKKQKELIDVQSISIAQLEKELMKKNT